MAEDTEPHWARRAALAGLVLGAIAGLAALDPAAKSGWRTLGLWICAIVGVVSFVALVLDLIRGPWTRGRGAAASTGDADHRRELVASWRAMLLRYQSSSDFRVTYPSPILSDPAYQTLRPFLKDKVRDALEAKPAGGGAEPCPCSGWRKRAVQLRELARRDRQDREEVGSRPRCGDADNCGATADRRLRPRGRHWSPGVRAGGTGGDFNGTRRLHASATLHGIRITNRSDLPLSATLLCDFRFTDGMVFRATTKGFDADLASAKSFGHTPPEWANKQATMPIDIPAHSSWTG